MKQVVNIINDWKCTIEGADILHLVYARNIAKKNCQLDVKDYAQFIIHERYQYELLLLE